MPDEPAGSAASAVRHRAITHRRVLTIALPIVLSNATIPILGAVDTAVVGQLGQAAPIGAVGIGAVILQSIYWVLDSCAWAQPAWSPRPAAPVISPRPEPC